MSTRLTLSRFNDLFRLSITLWGLGLALWLSQPALADGPALPTLLAPDNGATVTTAQPTFDWSDPISTSTVVSYTLVITGDLALTTTADLTTTESIYTPTVGLPNGVYTWTVQAHDSAGNVSGFAPPYTFTVEVVTATWLVYLPLLLRPDSTPTCPTDSSATYSLIPIDGAAADHPDYLHGDLNLSLRGYAATSALLGLVDYSGSTDSNAPQFAGLFESNRFPGISTVYQVNQWIWSCGTHGCPGSAITSPPVTLAGLITTRGESIFIPERSPSIYSGGYQAMVLYAAEQQITLGYTRQDTVAYGYAVHLENVCVDPNLLALYRAQTSAAGWHVTGRLPALRNNQALGTALGSEIQVAIRDRGTFMDPRSRKDWWSGY